MLKLLLFYLLHGRPSGTSRNGVWVWRTGTYTAKLDEVVRNSETAYRWAKLSIYKEM